MTTKKVSQQVREIKPSTAHSWAAQFREFWEHLKRVARVNTMIREVSVEMHYSKAIVAYLSKGVWYKPSEVEVKRNADRGAFIDALPYTIEALRRRRENGKDVPEWIDLDKQDK